ncbi:MAG: ABC transporter permease subunit [Kiritimatiellia bacterium]
MNRLQYLLRRLLLLIPTFFGITVVCFLLTRLLPGGPVEMRLAQMRGMGGGGEAGGGANVVMVSEDIKKELTRQFGFDQPLWKQYITWAWTNRLGMKMKSYEYPDRTSWELIRTRLPVSLWFGMVAFLASYLVCIPLGIAKALRHGAAFDFISSAIVFSAYAIPSFAIGMILKMFLSGTVDGLWDIFPIGGFESDNAAAIGGWTLFVDRAYHMVLPVTAYVMTSFALLTIMMKNSLMEQMSADYVRTVLSKGATRRRAIWGHALRNALIPIATGFGSVLGMLFAGSMIIETLFEIPGMGQLSLNALVGHDYAVFMAMLVMTASIQLFGNLISDFCYMLIDPRIHFD